MDLSRDDLLRLYQQMALARALAPHMPPPFNKLSNRYGSEAVTVGAAMALAADDIIVPQRHDLGAYLARGLSPADVLGQQAQSGDMRARLIAPPSQDAGKALAVAAGIALGTQLRDEQRVTLVYTDRVGVESADGYEALRFAALQHLPLVCVIAYPCKPLEDAVALEACADRIAAFGVPATRVDGGDALAVVAAASTAIDAARTGAGPVALVARLTVSGQHAQHDHDASDATDQDDPIARLEAALKACDAIDDERCAAIASATATSVAVAVAQHAEHERDKPLQPDRALYAMESAIPLGPAAAAMRVAVPVLSETGE